MGLRFQTPLPQVVASGTLAPNAITGLTLWLSGNDPAGTGTPPSGGSTVSTWVDKSGTGANFAAAGGASTYQTNVYISTRGVVRASGSSFFTNNTNTLLNSANPFTVAVTFKASSVSGFPCFLNLKQTGTGSSGYPIGNTNNATYIDIYTGNNGGWVSNSFKFTGGISAGTFYTLMITYNGSGVGTSGNFAGYLNNIGTASVSSPALGADPNVNWIFTDNAGDPWTGDIQQIVIYNKVLSGTEKNGLYSWLTTVAS